MGGTNHNLEATHMALVAWLWTGGTFGHEVRLVVRREVSRWR